MKCPVCGCSRMGRDWGSDGECMVCVECPYIHADAALNPDFVSAATLLN